MGEHSLQGQTQGEQPQPGETAGTSGQQQQQQQQQQQEQQQGVNELREICQLLWGPSIRQEIFHRWSQGFEFSDCEPSALVQRDGGPCCVIAPVQAYLMKILLMETPGHSYSDVSFLTMNRLA